MLITKVEPQELVDRQLDYLVRVGDPAFQLHRATPTTYRYNYIPGVQATNVGIVLDHLETHVWSKSSISSCDSGAYYGYILELIKQHRIKISQKAIHLVCRVSEQWLDSAQLVHGDATMENFIATDHGVIGIDPGLPRGFCHPDNDKGKLLQSVLTHWDLVRHGSQTTYRNQSALEVTQATLVSLLTHWIRIIKNADRHPKHVEWCGRKCVIPILERELEESANFPTVRYRWGAGRLDELHNRFLRASFDALRRQEDP